MSRNKDGDHTSVRRMTLHLVDGVEGSCSEERVLIGGVGIEGSEVSLACISGSGTLNIEAAYFGTPFNG